MNAGLTKVKIPYENPAVVVAWENPTTGDIIKADLKTEENTHFSTPLTRLRQCEHEHYTLVTTTSLDALAAISPSGTRSP